MLPVSCSEARGNPGGDYTSYPLERGPKAERLCWYAEPKLRTLFPEYNDMSKDVLSDKLYRRAGIELNPRSKPWNTLFRDLAIVFLPPVLVLLFGAALGWALSGFSGRGPKPS
jgi:hypothetical protein